MKKITKILVPTDFSDTSIKGVEQAAAVAEQLGAEMHIYHAVELGTFVYYGQEAYWPKDSTEKIMAAANKSMQDLVRKLGTKVPIKSHVESTTANAAIAICEFGMKDGCDLIALATHGRTGLDRVMLGSIAERVLRKATMPVLLLR